MYIFFWKTIFSKLYQVTENVRFSTEYLLFFLLYLYVCLYKQTRKTK